MRPVLPILILVPLLAACSTQRERCVRDATAELRVVERLIAETETNIERGFRIDLVPAVRPRLDVCVGSGWGAWGHGGFNEGWVFCPGYDAAVAEQPVAIDRNEERRKLATLQARRAELQRPTREALAVCDAQYPPS